MNLLTFFMVYGVWVILLSVVTFGFYAWDKGQAQRGGWRVPEARLHGLAFAGGFPGAYFAQSYLRHKTRKSSFQFVSALATAAHLICAGLLIWLIVSFA